MINETNNRNVISLLAVVMGVILAVVGYRLESGLAQSIVVNIASNLMTTGLFSLLILDRILYAQENRNRKKEKDAFDRNQQPIEVFLLDRVSNERFKLPLELLRGEFSRAEVLARIGMLPMTNKGDRFALEYTGNSDFFKQINKIMAYECNELEITCSREEIEQFKIYENRNKKKKENVNQQHIEVLLVDKASNEWFKLPLELLRGEFSRAEILGRIGMLPMTNNSGRFAFEYTSNSEFFSQINKIMANYDSNQLEIPCNREEIEQFQMYEEYRVR
jgi:hypothetical protein